MGKSSSYILIAGVVLLAVLISTGLVLSGHRGSELRATLGELPRREELSPFIFAVFPLLAFAAGFWLVRVVDSQQSQERRSESARLTRSGNNIEAGEHKT